MTEEEKLSDERKSTRSSDVGLAMKVPVPCFDCKARTATLDLSEGHFYMGQCANGHRVSGMLQNRRYETLFESAALAYADGYFRESVASFVATLEEVFRAYVRIVLRSKSVDASVAEKVIGKSSERQYGALMAVYALEENEIFAYPESRRTFRNEVVHNGKFPSRGQALGYGEFVYDTCLKLISLLNSKYKDAFVRDEQEAVMNANAERFKKDPDAPRVSTVLLGNLLRPEHYDFEKDHTFEEKLKTWREISPWSLSTTGTPPPIQNVQTPPPAKEGSTK